MFNRLRNLLTPPESKSSRTARLVAFESGGRARWTPRDYTGLAREGYLANAIVHRCVRLIAENAAACQYLVFEGAAERDAHPLARLLTRPNPRQDGGVFFEMLVAHLLLAGNAYVEAVALGDFIRELYALRPDRMKVVPGADGWAEAYDYCVGARCVRFDQLATAMPPILHLTFFHPLDDHYGLAPIEAAAVAVDQRDLPVTLDNAVHVGINTAASSPNLLSVKSNAALLTAINAADGGSGDARLQISKESAAKTASVFFSDAFSGRAEFGLVGSDAFKLKVSADGSTFVEAFNIDQTTGNLALPRGLSLTGIIAPPQITANQNDYNPTGIAVAAVLQLSSDASRIVSGLAGGAEGRVVSLINIGGQPIVLTDESASSSAANRFTLGANLTVAAKQAAMLRYDGAAARWRLIAGGATGLLAAANNLSDLASVAAARANLGVREQLTASRTYYVRTDGSDGNNGLANSSGGALLTIQKAIDTVAALDLSIYNVTIQVADGTHGGGVVVSAPWVGSGTVTLQGNTSTPANALLSTGASDCIVVLGGGTLTVTGFRLTNSGSFLLHASSGSIRFSLLTFGTCNSQQVRATDGGRITATGNYSIDGGAGNHWSALGNAIFRVQSKTITLTGTPAFSLAFANADLSSTVLVNGNSFSGSATGARYSVTNNAVISSGGGGATYLPGNAAGSTGSGGQYI